MQRLQQRKAPILSILFLLGIGTFFSIRVFSTASSEQKSPLRETDSLQNLSAQFTTSKIGTIKNTPEITVYAEVNGKVKSIAFATGTEIRGGQPIVTIADENERYTSQVELTQSQLQSTQELYKKTQENYKEQHETLQNEKELLQQQLHHLEQALEKNLISNEKQHQLQQQHEIIKQQALSIINQRTTSLNTALELLTTSEENQNTDWLQALLQNTTQPFQQRTEQLNTTERETTLQQLQEALLSSIQQLQQRVENNNAWEPNNVLLVQQLTTQLHDGLQLLTREQEQLTFLEQKDWETEKQQLIQQQENALYQGEKELEEKKLKLKLLENEYSTQRETIEHQLQSLRSEYEYLYNQYNKLSVRAPIAGTIQQRFVQEGEKVYEGTPLFTIQKPNEVTEIELQLTIEEYLSVLSVEQVQIKGRNTQGEQITTTGEILLRSPIANENGMYTLSIESKEKLDTTFSNVQIDVPMDSSFPFLPEELIEIKNHSEGYLYILSEGNQEKLPITLGKEWNNYREIKETLIPSLQIITNTRNTFYSY